MSPTTDKVRSRARIESFRQARVQYAPSPPAESAPSIRPSFRLLKLTS